jgi:DNA-binding FrmR family transcriptional regulator
VIMSHIEKEKQKLVARIKRIRGQVDSIERSLTTEDDCADVLMLLANIRGGINSLMAEVLEDHIRHHLLSPERSSAPPHELAEDMIELVRAYLKESSSTAGMLRLIPAHRAFYKFYSSRLFFAFTFA